MQNNPTNSKPPKVPKPLAGFAIGGFLGSMVPLVGTLVGAGVGAVVGGLLSLKDNEE
ncbi:glycine zipper domain-containing protein [Helicobacter labacensis]|uniref:glycine zipper domain-containing protein n=1 Tax=Helicobacter labacensis TaxID=2316079 RepID=UPI0013CE1DD2|nr:glycine zipper domain-containing protein [Helicobacter labacensis]